MILSTVSLTHTHTHVTLNANIITMVSCPELEVQVAAMVSEVLNQYSNTIIAVDAQNPTVHEITNSSPTPCITLIIIIYSHTKAFNREYHAMH